MAEQSTGDKADVHRQYRNLWESEYVWYACYGSNLRRDRFLAYIRGGRPKGSQKDHPGCHTKQLREKLPDHDREEPVILPYRLFFAGDYKNWGGGGVALLDYPPPDTQPDNVRTYARLYRISWQQFIDVFAQENAYDPADFRKGVEFSKLQEVGWKKLYKEGAYDVGGGGDYSQLVFLGERRVDKQDEPVFTFTNPPSLSLEPNEPSDSYLRTIVNGLVDTYPFLSDEVLCDYIYDCVILPVAREGHSDNSEECASMSDGPAREPGWTSKGILGLVTSVRDQWRGHCANQGRYLKVRPTEDREGANREFIVQLNRRIRDGLKVRAGDSIAVMRPFVLRAEVGENEEGHGTPVIVERARSQGDRNAPIQVTAVVNCAHERHSAPHDNAGGGHHESSCIEPHEIAIDQKLRAGLGVNVGGWIEVSNLTRRVRERGVMKTIHRTIDRAIGAVIGVQPELMRVQKATFEDMEIGICRVPEPVFDVLGIAPGDPVLIGSLTQEVRLRAAKLSTEQLDDREDQQRKYPSEFPTPHTLLELDRVVEVAGNVDMPPIFIDLEKRELLGVQPIDVVRVVRAPTGVLSFRLYLVIIPLFLVITEFALARWGANGWVAGGVFAGMLLVLGALAVWDLRNKIM